MTAWLLPVLVGAVALLYSSVGHGGATGYIAVMGLAGMPVEVIRPTALLLNVAVAMIGTVQFARAGHFRRDLLMPLAVGSVPAAAIGGWLAVPAAVLELLLGVVLGFSALRILLAAWHASRGSPSNATSGEDLPGRTLPWVGFVGLGILLGLASGLTGVGGGVFLTPLLLMLGVATTRQVAAVSVAFILVNSLAGLAGWTWAGRTLPPCGAGLILAAACGGVIGSQAGAFRLPVAMLKILMAIVLSVASVKMLAGSIEAFCRRAYGVTSPPVAEVRPRQVSMSMLSL